jgi:hypothetical protein
LENEMREYIIGFEMIKWERIQFQISKFKYARREGIWNCEKWENLLFI